jgi:hypothetical protein
MRGICLDRVPGLGLETARLLVGRTVKITTMAMVGDHTIGGVAVGAEAAGAPAMDISGNVMNRSGCQGLFRVSCYEPRIRICLSLQAIGSWLFMIYCIPAMPFEMNKR